MSSIYLIVVIILYIYMLTNLLSRATLEVFTAEEKAIIRHKAIKFMLVGLVCVILSIINAYCWTELPLWASAEFVVLILFLSVVAFISMLFTFLSTPTEEIIQKKRILEKSKRYLENYLFQCPADKVFSDANCDYSVAISDKEGQVIIYRNLSIMQPELQCEVISFSDIIQCEILRDNQIVKKTSMGRALAGAILAGPAGAAVGLSSKTTQILVRNLSIRIFAAKMNMPYCTIPIISKAINENSSEYRELYDMALKIHSAISHIIKNRK